MIKKLMILCMAVITWASCGKEDDPGENVSPPANLQVTATVSTDNSGNVAFTATADNAVVYLFDFGNGAKDVSATGVVNHKYGATGVYTVSVQAKNSTGQSISKSITVNVQVTLALVWSDEFDTPGAPDDTKWGYDIGAGGWGNNESQYYTSRSENVTVSGGTLKITARRESYNGSEFTSTRMLTRGKYSVKYGKIEVRAKLPTGVGTWPAIWMLGNNFSTVGWPACGEIDIMEHAGKQPNLVHGYLHHPGNSGGNPNGSSINVPTATTAFHRYAVEWNAATIKFMVDDIPFYTFTNNPNLPFNQNFFIILNIAMGGSFGGQIDPDFNQATMEIDYVRVYQ